MPAIEFSPLKGQVCSQKQLYEIEKRSRGNVRPMTVPRVGINVDDLRLAIKDGLRLAGEMDFRVVEMAAAGDVAPASLSMTGRRHLSHYVRGLGLEVASLAADLPGLRLSDPGTVDERVERTERILELAADLNVPVVTGSVGALTHQCTEANRRVCRHARYDVCPTPDP